LTSSYDVVDYLAGPEIHEATDNSELSEKMMMMMMSLFYTVKQPRPCLARGIVQMHTE